MISKAYVFIDGLEEKAIVCDAVTLYAKNNTVSFITVKAILLNSAI